MNNDENKSADKISGSTDLLGAVLDSFPFFKPSRIVAKEEGGNIAEWQFDGKYFEIEEIGNGSYEIIASDSNNKYSHWILVRNTD